MWDSRVEGQVNVGRGSGTLVSWTDVSQCGGHWRSRMKVRTVGESTGIMSEGAGQGRGGEYRGKE